MKPLHTVLAGDVLARLGGAGCEYIYGCPACAASDVPEVRYDTAEGTGRDRAATAAYYGLPQRQCEPLCSARMALCSLAARWATRSGAQYPRPAD